LIFIEASRDSGQASGIDALKFQRKTIAHEIGHLFALPHPTAANSSVMSQGFPVPLNFSDDEVKELRKVHLPVTN
jgi:hypothetical protein